SIKELFEKFDDKIELPADLAIDRYDKRVEISVEDLPTEFLIKDIGMKTCKKYSEIISKANTIVMNGPMGIYEDDRFAFGTIEVFKSIINSSAFSLIGGGHTVAAATKFNLKDRFSYVSTGGGALMKFLMEKSLPVVDILKKYSK
ncbi:MAG TPA: phosphoglycerate kinase, partial [Thermoprotei archaeon]|nr:phosphoglycerate kinase [Thermoprotei archaeon]